MIPAKNKDQKVTPTPEGSKLMGSMSTKPLVILIIESIVKVKLGKNLLTDGNRKKHIDAIGYQSR